VFIVFSHEEKLVNGAKYDIEKRLQKQEKKCLLLSTLSGECNGKEEGDHN